MKLYFFNPNTYDLEFSVMEKSKGDAVEKVKEYLFKEKQERPFASDEYERWKDASANDLPGKYTIEEYDVGEVVETESS